MSKEARPIILTLVEAEAAELLQPSGEGGHQIFHDFIRDQLAGGQLAVTFNDEHLGKLIRYMTQYGSGGFQGRLNRAFQRPIRELLAA